MIQLDIFLDTTEFNIFFASKFLEADDLNKQEEKQK
jgi:hypothetical protein